MPGRRGRKRGLRKRRGGGNSLPRVADYGIVWEGSNLMWKTIDSCPEGVEVMTKIDDADGERNVQSLIQRTRVPGVTRPMFFTPDEAMYVYYTPTHWRHP